MQGKLYEIDIRSIMQLIELGQRTGELFVEAYGSSTSRTSSSDASDTSQFWFVFFSNGQIIYAGDSTVGATRLKDYLRRYNLEHHFNQIDLYSIATLNAPEYGYLWSLLENHRLTPEQGRTIIKNMVQETLFDLFSLHQGSFTFEIGPALSPQLTTIEFSSLAAQIMTEVRDWKQLHPYIQSPDQCPVIVQLDALKATLKTSTLTTLTRWVDGQTSIRQLARYLNRDILTLARALYPYVYQGMVHLNPPRQTERAALDRLRSHNVPKILCIDDSVTIGKSVEFILSHQGYDATAIADPVQALSLLFRLKPDLILCDIAMPELDGYEICAMLRKSTQFRQTPIVMLTGKDGFIDRVRARMVEATNYLTKPFGAAELITLVEQYVGGSQPRRDFSPDLSPDLLSASLDDSSEPNSPSLNSYG
jgi:twitching motility two-component system response regulator PilG